MAAKGSALAQFLRARRSLVRPADVGLPAGERRRVAGLRREEVAILAGISTDYCLRLEQGRETNPSDQVLTSIARALRLETTRWSTCETSCVIDRPSAVRHCSK